MVTRAGVPTSAFYEVFESAEECLWAAFDEGAARLSDAVLAAAQEEERWIERIRLGVIAFLRFLSDEPQWAEFLIVRTPAAGKAGLKRRQRLLRALAELLSDGRRDALSMMGAEQEAVMPEPVAGGVLSVLHARLQEGGGESLPGLAPSLTSFIVVSYLGPAATQTALAAERSSASGAIPPVVEMPVRATLRTAQVLHAIAGAPLSSNRRIAEAAGLTDEGQTSKLLGRLEQRGLIENVGLGHVRGEPNAWLLTRYGRQVTKLSAYPLAQEAQPDQSEHLAVAAA